MTFILKQINSKKDLKFNIKNIFLEKTNNIENNLMSLLGNENKKLSVYEPILKSLANCKNKTLSDIARFIQQPMNSVHNLLKILIVNCFIFSYNFLF
ncbi:hypothetical protein [Columbia Basin potato purple top phytoplasma]|uniref:AAA family ATPase n=1 Tax=Columbia Basin potato purple top phytoplasma TaxID=307134 RepID=A0ABT5L8F4_9MOLU|nr:hypothetical protein [Columbia Basin potato purple top phytoplasma]MDC9031946.1 AAA family ATPase [Columbia Basin potato purple top phytoplasma]